MKSFDNWNYEEVEDAFGLQQHETCDDFKNWLTTEGTTYTEIESKLLDNYRKLLFKEVENWNEDELKLFL